MHETLPLLCEIVASEYAQWLRYTYLSALGFGLETDVLSKHFRHHASDELEHADIISRWIVDIGGLPPTEVPVVEQVSPDVNSALEWLIEYEVAGIEKYMCLLDMDIIPALRADVEQILSKEHEHLSDLQKLLVKPEDPTVIIIARTNKKKAVGIRGLFELLKPEMVDSEVNTPEEFKYVALDVIERKIMDPKSGLYTAYQNAMTPKGKGALRNQIAGYSSFYKMIKDADDESLDTFMQEMKIGKYAPQPAAGEEKEELPSSLEEVMGWAGKIPFNPEVEEAPTKPAAPAKPTQPAQPKQTQPAQPAQPEQDDELAEAQRILQELEGGSSEARRPSETALPSAMVKDHVSGKSRSPEQGMKLFNYTIRNEGGDDVKKREIGTFVKVAPSGDLVVKDGTGQEVYWKSTDNVHTSKK